MFFMHIFIVQRIDLDFRSRHYIKSDSIIPKWKKREGKTYRTQLHLTHHRSHYHGHIAIDPGYTCGWRSETPTQSTFDTEVLRDR